MNKQEDYQTLIDELLNKPTDREGQTTLKKIGELIKASRKKHEIKKNVVDYVEETLNREKTPSGRARTWLLSILQLVNTPEAIKIVKRHLFEDPSTRVRAWAAVCLTQMELSPDDLKKTLNKAFEQDEAGRVRAMALRLLIENSSGEEQDAYVDKFQQMILEGEADERLGVFRVICHEASQPLFSEQTEQELIEAIRHILQDVHEWRDIRARAAQALGVVKHKKPEAIKVLTEALKDNPAKFIQLACIRALAELYEPRNKEMYQEPLLLILNDDRDEEIQLSVIESIRRIASKADREVFIDFIIEELVRQSDSPDSYLDALRRIDNENAAKILGAKLIDPDLNISERAAKALTALGGNEAARILQAQRRRTLDNYTQLLDTADARIGIQFDTLMRQARFAFYSSMTMHIIVFFIGVTIFFGGFYLATKDPDQGIAWFNRFLGVGASITGFSTLLILFYKDPFRNIGHSLNRLVRINVVFLGYVRQVNQIDATFKQMFLTEEVFDFDMMKKLVSQIQTTVDDTLHTVRTYVLDEEHELGVQEDTSPSEALEADSPPVKDIAGQPT